MVMAVQNLQLPTKVLPTLCDWMRGDADNGATSLIRVVGDPLESASWSETVLYQVGRAQYGFTRRHRW